MVFSRFLIMFYRLNLLNWQLLNSINSYAGDPTLTSSFSSKRPFLDQLLRTQNEFSPGISFQGISVGNWHSLVTPNVQNYHWHVVLNSKSFPESRLLNLVVSGPKRHLWGVIPEFLQRLEFLQSGFKSLWALEGMRDGKRGTGCWLDIWGAGQIAGERIASLRGRKEQGQSSCRSLDQVRVQVLPH